MSKSVVLNVEIPNGRNYALSAHVFLGDLAKRLANKCLRDGDVIRVESSGDIFLNAELVCSGEGRQAGKAQQAELFPGNC